MLAPGARDDIGEAQELRTHDESRGSSGIVIDAKTDLIVFIDKLNHDAALCGTLELGYGEYGTVSDRAQNLVKVITF